MQTVTLKSQKTDRQTDRHTHTHPARRAFSSFSARRITSRGPQPQRASSRLSCHCWWWSSRWVDGRAHQLAEVLLSGPLSGERKADPWFTSDQQAWQSKNEIDTKSKSPSGKSVVLFCLFVSWFLVFFYDYKTMQANDGKLRIFKTFINK